MSDFSPIEERTKLEHMGRKPPPVLKNKDRIK